MIENFDVFKDENNNCFQLRTKTNAFTLEFDNKEKENIFLKIVNEIQKHPNLSIKQIKSKLVTKDNEALVIDVLKTLDDYELLNSEMSTELGLKNHNSNYQYSTEKKQLSQLILSIIGNGNLSKTLLLTAKNQSFRDVKFYNYNEIKEDNEIENIVSQSDFLIVDGNEWSPYYIELINKISLHYNKPWLYVGGFEGTSIKIGPLFYGKETGCYNCLISRLKSNNEYPAFLNSYEHYLRNNKKSSKPDIIPNADIIYNITANLALLEVMKFIEEWSLPITWRTLLNFEITGFNLTKHALLKKPFCEVCKPVLEYNPAPWLESVTLK